MIDGANCTASTVKMKKKKNADSLELTEDVSVLGWDAAGLEHSDPEGKDAAHLQLACQPLSVAQLGVFDVAHFKV